MSTTCAPTVKRRRQLAEPGVEAQRQRGEDHVVGDVAEVVADALAADEEVAVAEHDALRLAGASGGVEDRRHVEVDRAPRLELECRVHEFDPGERVAITFAVDGGHVADHDHVPDSGAFVEDCGEQREALGRRDQDTNVAVTEDVPDLRRTEQRIDRDERSPRRGDAEHGLDRLRPLLEKHRDPIAFLETDSGERTGHLPRPAPELGVGAGDVLDR